MRRKKRAILVSAVLLTEAVAFLAAGAVWPERMVTYGRLFTARTWHVLEVITFLLFAAAVALGTSGWTRARNRSSESQQR